MNSDRNIVPELDECEPVHDPMPPEAPWSWPAFFAAIALVLATLVLSHFFPNPWF